MLREIKKINRQTDTHADRHTRRYEEGEKRIDTHIRDIIWIKIDRSLESGCAIERRESIHVYG